MIHPCYLYFTFFILVFGEVFFHFFFFVVVVVVVVVVIDIDIDVDVDVDDLFCSGLCIPSGYKNHNEYKTTFVVEPEDLIYLTPALWVILILGELSLVRSL